MRFILALVMALGLSATSTAGLAETPTGAQQRFVFHPDDYRKGEIAHTWPKRGVWQVVLRAGGHGGTDTCMVATGAGVQELVFFLVFEDDGQTLTVGWMDTNFAPMVKGFHLRTTLRESAPSSSRADWKLVDVPRMGSIDLVDGLKFYIVKDQFVAWNAPNKDPNSPNALSADQVLSRIAQGHSLYFHDEPMAPRRIPLAGFAAAVKDFRNCEQAIDDAD